MAKNRARKGREEETQIVKDIAARGYKVRRQPGSGNRAVDLQHDVVWFDSPVGKLHLESKYKVNPTWKTCENDRDGADILLMRSRNGRRKAYLDWDLLLALVGDAAVRDDLSALEAMDKRPWSETPKAEAVVAEMASMMAEDIAARRQRIQSAHQNPKPKPAKPNKLRGRGFGK